MRRWVRRVAVGVPLAVLAALLLWAALHRAPPQRDWRARAAARLASERRATATLALGALAVASATRAAATPAVEATKRIAAADLPFEWLLARCKRDARCGRGTSDVALCVDEFADILTNDGARLAVRDGETIYDPVAAARFVAEDEAAPCSATPRSWRQAFTGRRHEGEPCWDSVSCESPLICTGTARGSARLLRRRYNRRGICIQFETRPPKLGDTCTWPWDCGSTMSCGEHKTCQPQRPLGAACRDSHDCGDGLRCVAGRCVPTPQEGSACQPTDLDSCGAPLSCGPDAVCRQRGDIGHACDPRASFGCRRGLKCIAGPSGSTCQPWRREGEPCTTDGDCGDHTHCEGLPDHGMCVDDFWSPLVPGWARDLVDDAARPFYE